MKNKKTFDVIIIGGSYAGLSAGMSLGRAMRQVLIIDGGNPCNKQTPHSHNFITQDGERPADIANKAKKQMLLYQTVTFQKGKVVSATKSETNFKVKTEAGEIFITKKLIFATGLTDIMPDINGFAECWGISILHCPYCHGYEFKNGKTGLWGTGDLGFELSKLVSNWTKNLTLFTNGKSTLTNEQTTKIKNHSIEIVESEIEHIEHKNGLIENVICKDENKYSVKALYVKLQFKQHCDLPKNLGCEMTEQGLIKVDILQKTSVYGVYSAGDNSAWGRAVSIAIATGSVAGMSINKEMIDEEF